MRLNKTVGLLAGTTALTLGGFCYGNTDEANTSALSQIAELKAELAAMKAQQGEEWLTEQRAADIRGIVQDVLADAETRTSLQSSGATAGYDNGFFISSADGNFRLNLNGLVQFQWILNSAKDRNTQWGFNVRRARMDFSGVLAQDWNFKFQMQYGSAYNVAAAGVRPIEVTDPVTNTSQVIGAESGGGINVLDAYLEREVDLGGTMFTVRGGQFKAPFLREWLVDDQNQLAVDRSLLNYFFYQGYSVGLQGEYASDSFRATIAYTNGVGTPVGYNVGSYGTSWLSSPTQYSFAGRADFKLSGSWDQFDDFNSRPGTEAGVMVGIGALYQKYNNNADDYVRQLNDPTFGITTANSKVFGLTADLTWDFGGASLFASFVWQNVDAPDAGLSTLNPWGFTVQGGYFLTDDFELFGRYSYADLDVPDSINGFPVPSTGLDGFDSLNVVTFGVNYFLSSNVKLTADLSWSLDTLGIFQSSGAGFREDVDDSSGNANDNQVAIRTQLQLTF